MRKENIFLCSYQSAPTSCFSSVVMCITALKTKPQQDLLQEPRAELLICAPFNYIYTYSFLLNVCVCACVCMHVCVFARSCCLELLCVLFMVMLFALVITRLSHHLLVCLSECVHLCTCLCVCVYVFLKK